jgi:hypothetical protein
VPRNRQPRSFSPIGCADDGALIHALVRDAEIVPADNSTSYDVSYPEFLNYFKKCGPIENHQLIIAANFAYGWMPTILDFVSRDFEKGVAYLERARTGERLSVSELKGLAKIVNNSTVGASKLLHFACPAGYAIWDSNVAKYLGARIEYTDRGAEQYAAYNDCIRRLSESSEAAEIAKAVSTRVGYDVGTMRALELVMFHAGKAGRLFKSNTSPSPTLANTR